MGQAHTDRNLMVGVIALQLDFISRDALIAAMNTWILNKNIPLSTILIDQGALTESRPSLLDTLVDEHIRIHDGDPHKSLASLTSVESIRRDIAEISDTEVQASIGALGSAPIDADSSETVSLGESTSDGLRFRILRFHAKGGLGQVSVALDQELNRKVALKEIQEQHADWNQNRSRFVQEAEITGKLEHPGIIPVYGLGHDAKGRPFYAMRFIEGDSLSEAIRRFHSDETLKNDTGKRFLRLRELLRRFQDACNAVAYAHSRGVLHRDLKPGNIMLGPFGETLVVDWGLAKPTGKSLQVGQHTTQDLLDEPVQLSDPRVSWDETMPGSVIGTPGYMSPEQAAGRIDLLSTATDVYGLGAILYSLLTGKAPVEREGADLGVILRRVQTGEIPRPRTIDQKIPKPLEAICVKALALRIEDRYPSAKAVADDVERWLADEAVSSYREPLSEQVRRWARKHPALIGMAGVLLFAGLVGSLVVTGITARKNDEIERKAEESRQNAAEATKNAEEAKLAKDKVLTAKTESDRLLYIAEMNLVGRDLEAGDVRHVDQRLDRYATMPEPEDLRGFEWYYFRNVAHQEFTTLTGTESVAFSPDGGTFASVSEDAKIKIRDVATNKETVELQGNGKGFWPVAFSPDGRLLAAGTVDNAVMLWDIATGKVNATLNGHQQAVASVRFSPDGRTLASASSDRTIKLWDIATGKVNATLNGHDSMIRTVAFSPDGRTVASGSWDKSVKLWDASTGKLKSTFQGHQDPVSAVAFGKQGQVLASAAYDRTIKLWDIATGKELKTLRGHRLPIESVSFGPDGQTLASGAWDPCIKVWDIATGKELKTLRGHHHAVNSVAFSSDGRTLASASNDIKLWDLTTRPATESLQGHRASVTCIAYSPDGLTLATASKDKSIKLWDTASAQEKMILRGPRKSVTSLAFRSDGRTLASTSWDNEINLWDLTTSKMLATIKIPVELKSSIAFSPNGRRLACADWDKTLKLLDLDAGGMSATLPAPQDIVRSVTFSPDGRTLAIFSDDRTLRLLDLDARGTSTILATDQLGVTSIAFSPDGRTLAFDSSDRTIGIWDIASRKERLRLNGHQGRINSLAFSPDGRTLASGSGDKTIRLWDTVSGREKTLLSGQGEEVNSVTFSPNGQTLASTTKDGILTFWDGTPRTPERLQQKRAVGLALSMLNTMDSSRSVRRQRIQEMASIGDPLRSKALEEFDRLSVIQLNRLVENLVDQAASPDEIRKQINSNRMLDDEDRSRALNLAEKLSFRLPSADQLNEMSWDVLVNRNSTPDELAWALRKAESATKLEPGSGIILTTLGVAQYRNGHFEDALKTLERSLKLNEKTFEGPVPADLGVLAMSQLRLGKIVEARTNFKKMAEAMKTPRWMDFGEAKGFFAEAEELFRELKVPTTEGAP